MTGFFARLGNDLHAGRRVVPVVRRRRLWYLIALVAMAVLAAIAVVRGPQLGIEFTGGSEFQVAGVADTSELTGREAVREIIPDHEPSITVLGGDTMRVQTEQLDSASTAQMAQALASAYDVPVDQVSSSFIGPTWGQDITGKMLRAIAVFVVLVGAIMALYFRNTQASIAAILALVHDTVLTMAVYGVVGFEVTPATIIGFLTILGYSMYDTIVVFDKVRERTADLSTRPHRTFAELVEEAANQTIMRSINTSVVALLPVGSILVIGALILGAGTLKDISLALFVGIFVGTFSSILLAPGLLVDLRRRERPIREHDRAVLARDEREEFDLPAGDRHLSDGPQAPADAAADEAALTKGTAHA